MSNKALIESVKKSLSAARMATYEAAAGVSGDEDLSALNLYAWNAKVSGALLAPLHLCEVVVRNAVAEAFEAMYGQRWPWSPGLERSLPDPAWGYSPRKDLQNARRSAQTTGKVIPELKFAFWQNVFTQRHDSRLWKPHLMRVMPNLDASKSISELRHGIYNELECMRKLRNRIAHHEPIFKRNLSEDFIKMVELVGARCKVTAGWMVDNQQATDLICLKL